MGYHVRVKICGVTSPEDALGAAIAGADAVGLNFYPKSPRYVGNEVASAILRTLPPFVGAVGVFAGERPERMVEVVERMGRPITIQSHGGWPSPAAVTPHPLILAVHVEDAGSLAQLTSYLTRCRASGQIPAAVLIDARVPGQYGGTGHTAPWHLLAEFRADVPLILAGGLTQDNVAEAIRIVRPYAVDVASGIEKDPGRKDLDRVRRFIDNARAAALALPG